MLALNLGTGLVLVKRGRPWQMTQVCGLPLAPWWVIP
jgi:hypothetical protein